MNKNFLATRRIEIGLSQKDIAEKLGYSVQSVSQWENGKSFPALSSWGKYASLLNVDLNGFLLEKKQKQDNLCNDLKFSSDVFSRRLKYLRKKNNYNQGQLATILNVSKHSIIAYEKGLSTPNKEQFIALCNLFSISANGLYFSIDEEKTLKKGSSDKKKRTLMPILIPILVVLVIGGGTGVAVITTERNKIIDINDNSDSDVIETFVPTMRFLEYGLYPQTVVDDEMVINNLDSLMPDNLGIYHYGNQYYYKINALFPFSEIDMTSTYPTSFSNNQPIESGATYYFKIEPIKWQVLQETNADYLLYSDIVLDTHSFDDDSNNYKDSSIRAFINNDFYQLAFFKDDTKIIETKVDNSLASTLDLFNENVCEDTFDKVFLASQADIYNVDYDFDQSYKNPLYSDFVSAKRVLVPKNVIPKTSAYWLRSPGIEANTARLMRSSVGGDEYGINPPYGVGVRPMIRLKK